MSIQTAPLTIRLYDPNNEFKEYSRAIVPWGVFKLAIRLSKNINEQDPTEEDLDAIAGLIIMAFGDQFTLDELDKGADATEMMTILNTIMAKANAWNKAATPT